MDEKTVKCAIAHFNKKLTDYQMFVNKEIRNQDEQIKSAENYLINTLDSLSKRIDDILNNIWDKVKPAKLGEVTLLANQWVGEASPYSQIVTIDGTTENSQVDLTPSVEQLAIFYEKDLTFVTENEGGVVTVYAIGQKPQNDYTIQVTITEVAYE